MTGKRVPLILVAAIAVVALVIVLFVLDSSGDRSNRTRDPNEASRTEGGGEEGGPGSGEAVVDAARLAALIKEHGGCTPKGELRLTLPEAPAIDLDVVVRGRIGEETVEARGRSDQGGRFVLSQLPRAGSYKLHVVADRIQPFMIDVDSPTGEDYDLGVQYLDRWYFFNGRVVGSGSRGVSGADVALVAAAGGTSFSFREAAKSAAQEDEVVAETKAEPDGTFSMRLKMPGIFTARARAEGWAPHYRSEVYVSAGDTNVILPLTRGYDIVGYVLDAAGRPIPGASVTYWANSRRFWSFTKEVEVTDTAGRFEFRLEPAARRYVVSVNPPTGLSMTQQFEVPMTDDLIVQMPGTGVLTGRITDAATNQPVPGAEVLLTLNKDGAARMRQPDFSKLLLTDAYGAFRVEGVGPGKINSINIRAEGYADMRLGGWQSTDPELWKVLQGVEVSGNSEVRLPEIPLPPGRVLTGVVMDAKTRAPLAGASVELWDFVMGSRATETFDDGSYRFTGVGARVAMIVKAVGYAEFRDSPMGGFALPGEGDSATRDVELKSGGSVKGTVRTKDGQPVAGALVRLQTAETGWQSWQQAIALRSLWTNTDADGNYDLRGVPELKLYAEAQAPSYDRARSKTAKVDAGDMLDKLDIVLLPGAQIDGVVTSREGGPVSGVRITVAADPGETQDRGAQWRAFAAGVYAFSDEEGRFRVNDVPIGDVLVRVEGEGFATLTKSRKGVSAGEKITAMRLDLSPALTIHGQVIDEAGKPVVNAWVRAQQTTSSDGEASNQTMGARLEADGTFTIRNLPEGTYTVEVRTRGWGDQAPRYEELKREGVVAGEQQLLLQLIKASE